MVFFETDIHDIYRKLLRIFVAGIILFSNSFLTVLAGDSSNQIAEITVSYTLLASMVSPRTEIGIHQWTQKFRLSGSNVLNREIYRDGVKISTWTAFLGQKLTGDSKITGKNTVTTLSVMDGAIVQTDSLASYSITTTIKMAGKESCSASRIYKLKAGYKLFEDGATFSHAPLLESDLHAENVQCSIKLVAN